MVELTGLLYCGGCSYDYVKDLYYRYYEGIYGWITDWGLAFLLSFLFTLLLVLILSSLVYKFIEQAALKYGTKFILKKKSGRKIHPEIVFSEATRCEIYPKINFYIFQNRGTFNY